MPPDSAKSAAIDRDNPWPGLASFTEEAHGFFFGRERETDELVRLVSRQTLTVLFGQSGLGKSSLLQAGLFPLLRASDHLPLYLRLDHAERLPIADGQSPGGKVAAAPNSALGNSLVDQVKAALIAAFADAKADAPAFRADETLWEYFHRKDVDIWSAKNRLLTPVLAFDQFEEIFTLGRADEASRARSQAFLAELACLVENRPPAAVQEKLDRGELDPARFNHDKPSCRVILSLREDFLPDLEGLRRDMPALMHNRLRLKKLSGTQALEIVARPAPQLLAEGVAEKIVEFVAGARGGSAERLAELDVEPPLLSVICRELNDRRRALGQAQITADLVSGNRREILHDFYERSVADLPDAMRAFVEDRLLTKSGFRDNLALESALEFPGVTRPLLDTLVARRLLRIEERLGVQRVELTHDVLAEVIRASRDTRQQRLALEQAREREQRALAAAAQRTRRLRWLVGALTAVVAAFCVAGVLGLRQRRLAFESASRTDATFGSRLLEEGNTAEGFAYFVRAARKNPHNASIAPRLASALVSRNFLLPEGAPLVLPAAVLSVDYSFDGAHAWVLSDDGVVRLIDARERRIVQEFHLEAKVEQIVFPEDNDRVFVVRFANQSLQVCDSATGQPLTPVIRSQESLRLKGLIRGSGIFLSRDGRWLAACTESKAFIWDGATGQLRSTIDFGARTPFSVVFSPDGQRVLTTVNGGIVRQWSASDGSSLLDEMKPPVNQSGLLAVAEYSRDGRLFGVCWNTSGGQLFETDTGKKVGPALPQDVIGEAHFSHDGSRFIMLGASGGVGSVRTWNAATGAELSPPFPVPGRVYSSALSRDERTLLALDREGSVRIWDMNSGKLLAEPTPAIGKKPQAALSPDGTNVVVASGTAMHFFRLGAGAARPLTLRRDAFALSAPFLSGTPSRMLWLGREGARVLEVSSGRELPGGFAYPKPYLGFTPMGSNVRADGGAMVVATATSSASTTPTGWEAWMLNETGVSHAVALEDAPIGTPPTANWVRFSPTGDLVALVANTSAESIRVWNMATGKPVAPAMTFESRIAYANTVPASFSADGKYLVAGTISGTARVWEIATGRQLFDLGPPAGTVRFTAFSPDGTRLAIAAGADNVRVWDMNTGRLIHEPITVDGTLTSLGFSEDSRALLTSTGVEARVWDARSGEPIGEPIPAFARSAQFNRDATLIAVADNNSNARVWDAHTFQPVTEPLPHPGVRVVRATFSPDDRFLRTEPSDAHFQFWSIPPPARDEPVPGWLLDLATICVGKRLTDAGNLESAADALAKIDDIRRTLAALPEDAPYAEWGRWFLADRATRSIAPGFTITPAEAEKLAQSIGAP